MCPNRIYNKMACLYIASRSAHVNAKRAVRCSIPAEAHRSQEVGMGETWDKRREKAG